MRLRTRIALIFILLLATALAASLGVVSAANQANARGEVQRQLDTGTLVFSRVLDTNRRQLTQAAQAVASDYGFREAVATRDTDTVVTRAVSGRPARGIRNRLITTLEAAGPPALGYPGQAGVTGEVRAAGARADDPEMIALWAGQAAGLSGEGRSAREIVDEVMAEAARLNPRR